MQNTKMWIVFQSQMKASSFKLSMTENGPIIKKDTFYGTPFKISLFSLSLLLRHLQETMGRVAWRLSRSWPLKKACALLTRTRSTVTQGRNITTAF